ASAFVGGSARIRSGSPSAGWVLEPRSIQRAGEPARKPDKQAAASARTRDDTMPLHRGGVRTQRPSMARLSGAVPQKAPVTWPTHPENPADIDTPSRSESPPATPGAPP